jgi:hypothetical protein
VTPYEFAKQTGDNVTRFRSAKNANSLNRLLMRFALIIIHALPRSFC